VKKFGIFYEFFTWHLLIQTFLFSYMKSFIHIAILMGIISSNTALSQSKHSKILQKNIQKVLKKQDGTFAVAFKNLSTGKELLVNAEENFHAASTMKTPVMIEVFKQAKQGRFSLNDSIVIKNEFKSIVDSSVYSLDSSDDSETEIYRHIGEKRSLYDLLYQMITSSSNLSTNLIIGLVDAKNVMKTMREMGAKKIMILRGVEDNKAFEKGLNNTTTAYDLMLIFEKIANGSAVDQRSSEEMIKILLNQEDHDIIPAELPKDLKVAHKTGWITSVHHDSGIVFLPNGKKYILVLLSKNLKDEKAAVKAMADVSKMIYDFVNR
jgi:beta-lactamase class A